jgi:hypothetical protein
MILGVGLRCICIELNIDELYVLKDNDIRSGIEIDTSKNPLQLKSKGFASHGGDEAPHYVNINTICRD